MSENTICCIYIIISPSFKIYIGQTINFKKRCTDYRNHKNTKGQRKLNASFCKYGFNNHSISPIFICERTELNIWEKFYIKLFDSFNSANGMNLTSGGDSKIVSDETKQILRNINLGKKQSEETKQKKSDSYFKNIDNRAKKVWTDELRKKMVRDVRGSKNPNYGKGMKPHVKEALLKVNLGVKRTDEFKLKQSLARKGKPKSEEWKAANRKPKTKYVKNGVDILKKDLINK